MDIETGSKGGDGMGWDVNADSAPSSSSPLSFVGQMERTNWVIADGWGVKIHPNLHFVVAASCR